MCTVLCHVKFTLELAVDPIALARLLHSNIQELNQGSM